MSRLIAKGLIVKSMYKPGLAVLIASMVFVSHLHAYEVLTHERLSDLAARSMTIYTDPSKLADIGMPAQGQAAYPLSIGGTVDMVTAIRVGAAQEDTEYSVRVFNHFFDPQYNNFAGRGMQVGPAVGHPSPNWAIEDTGEITDINLPRAQEFSVRNMQHYYYNALVAGTRQQRLAYFALALEAAGHAIHHIQDMAQPQHTRNDQHVHPVLGTNPDWSMYERYSEGELTLAKILELRDATGYPAPVFQTSREFWHTPNTSIARYSGMAEFTSNNYVSYGKMFRGSWNNGNLTLLPAADLPKPDAYNPDGTTRYVETQNLTIRLTTGAYRSGPMDFVMGKVYDPVYGGMTAGQRLASPSILDMQPHGSTGMASISGRANVFNENSAVYDDQHRILIPRALAFSTGLVNHIFRGRLGLERGLATGQWVITNLSGLSANGSFVGQPMNGVVSLYYDDASSAENRFAIVNGSASLNLAFGQSMTIGSASPPPTAKRVIAVFRGRIGGEGETGSNPGFYAVAGKEIVYEPPVIPCGSPFSAAGGSEGTERLMDLGSTSGTVQGEFEAYSIRDSMEVRRGGSGGPLLFSTNGLVSGYHIFNFNHPGGHDAATNRLWIKVVGNVSTLTQWTSTIGCPGQQIGNPDRVRKRYSIRFRASGAGGGTGCPSGRFEIYLNEDFTTQRASMPWGSQGGSLSQPFTITEGSHQHLYVKSVTTNFGTPGAIGCTPISRPYLIRRNGTEVDVSNYNGYIALP